MITQRNESQTDSGMQQTTYKLKRYATNRSLGKKEIEKKQ
jgi:hypothetical protein